MSKFLSQTLSRTKWRFSFSQTLILMGLNLILAPAVWAVSQGDLTKSQAYAIAGLILVTLGLSIYLFVVIIYPEKF